MEWSSLTKIKELKMTNCGLDGVRDMPKRAAADVIELRIAQVR